MQSATLSWRLARNWEKALEKMATIVKPDTIMGRHRKLVAQKCDGFQQRRILGLPRVAKELGDLVVYLTRENRSWGDDHIAAALMHLGYSISGQEVGNILMHHGIPRASERKRTTMDG
jgi:putative transposase